jgi:hypothetical protein
VSPSFGLSSYLQHAPALGHPDIASPERLDEPDFRKEMNDAREEIDREVGAGRDDSWALADLILANLVCGFLTR